MQKIGHHGALRKIAERSGEEKKKLCGVKSADFPFDKARFGDKKRVM